MKTFSIIIAVLALLLHTAPILANDSYADKIISCVTIINQAIEEGSISVSLYTPRGRDLAIVQVNPFFWARLDIRDKAVFAECIAISGGTSRAALLSWVSPGKLLAFHDKGKLIDLTTIVEKEE